MRSFTADEANRTLPLVSRIVRDIVTLYPQWRERVNALELAAVTARADDVDPRVTVLEREAQDLAGEIESCIREIRELGIEYKTPLDAGLVDFPAEVGGRNVYLCWQLGEPAVEYWHEVDAGYAGRQPLAPVPVPDHLTDIP